MEPCRWKFDRIMLCGISKQQMHTRLNNFLQNLSRYRFCIALYGRSGNKRWNLNELNFDVKFCETEAENIQAIFHILLA